MHLRTIVFDRNQQTDGTEPSEDHRSSWRDDLARSERYDIMGTHKEEKPAYGFDLNVLNISQLSDRRLFDKQYG